MTDVSNRHRDKNGRFAKEWGASTPIAGNSTPLPYEDEESTLPGQLTPPLREGLVPVRRFFSMVERLTCSPALLIPPSDGWGDGTFPEALVGFLGDG